MCVKHKFSWRFVAHSFKLTQCAFIFWGPRITYVYQQRNRHRWPQLNAVPWLPHCQAASEAASQEVDPPNAQSPSQVLLVPNWSRALPTNAIHCECRPCLNNCVNMYWVVDNNLVPLPVVQCSLILFLGSFYWNVLVLLVIQVVCYLQMQSIVSAGLD